MPDNVIDATKVEVKEAPKLVNLKDVAKEAAVEAAKAIGKDIETKEAKESKEEIKESVKAEDKKESAKQDDEYNEEDLTAIKTLYKGLKNPDPKIQIGTLKILANLAGMDLTDIKTEKQAEKAEETLIDLLKNGLGEYDFLADKLGPVLEKVLDRYVDKKTADIRQELKLDKEAKQRESIEKTIGEVFTEFDNAKDLQQDVYKLMEQYQPSKNISPKEYFKSLVVIAAHNKGIDLKSKDSKQVDKKVETNRKDAMSRLASERGAEVKESTRIPSRMTLKEAVADAAEKAAELLASSKK